MPSIGTKRYRKIGQRYHFDGGNKSSFYKRPVYNRALNIKQQRQVKRIANAHVEKKFFIYGNSLATTNTATLDPVSIIPQNTGAATDSNRLGDRIDLTGFKMYFEVNNVVTNTTINVQVIRFFVFQWRPNSTNLVPTAAQLFLNDPVTSGISVDSEWAVDNQKSFKVLYDRKITMQGLGNNTAYNPYMHIERKKRFYKNFTKRIQYTSGAITGTNNIYIGYLNNQATTPATGKYIFRFNYVDQ